MLVRMLAAVALLLLPFRTVAQSTAAPAGRPQDKLLSAQTFAAPASSTKIDYLLFLPREYQTRTNQPWPMILFLHGAGERGSNVWQVNIHGPSKYIATHPEFPFILVAPQCPADEVWCSESLLRLLKHVSGTYRVDTNRVYLTGLSMGGYGTWELGLAHPERFAAIAPICGGGRTIHVLLARRGLTGKAKLNALRTLGVWAFHGGKDTVVPPSETERMIEALQEAEVAELHYRLYPEAGHDSWTETYNDPELYEWFLKHSRGPVR